MSESALIKVLIVDGFSNHDWPRTTRLIREVLQAAGIFSVSVSTAPETIQANGWNEWRPDFATYDVVVQTCNDYGGGPQWPEVVRLDFEKFVREGGGLYVFHSANNAFPTWPEYDRMIGLGWRSKQQGWAVSVNDDGTFARLPPGAGADTTHAKRHETTVVRRGDHELHRNLPRRWRTPALETYQYIRGPAEQLEIIAYAYDEPTQLNWPIEWTILYGEGRVYNSTFGHVWRNDANLDGMRCAGVQTMMVRALQWLAKRPVSAALPGDFPSETAVSLRTFSESPETTALP